MSLGYSMAGKTMTPQPKRRWYKWRTTLPHWPDYWHYVYTDRANAVEAAIGAADTAGRCAGFVGDVDKGDYQVRPIKHPPIEWLESERKEAAARVCLLSAAIGAAKR